MTETEAGVITDDDPSPPSTPAQVEGDELRARRSERAALAVFVAFVAVAFPLVLFKLGAYHWFFRDDWFFIAGRESDSLDDLFRPHNAHWSTVPVIAFRGLYALFGVRSYVPYQAGVLLLHLTTVVLLRVVMRRAGVGPWVATAAAASLVLFGPGSQNIVWAFQIGFTGSVVFGLGHLILADHDGPVDRRDWLGLGAGLLSLMSSGVGVTMAIVVGIATLLRRGWRVAALHAAPLAAVYCIYSLVEHPQVSSPFGRPPFDVVVRWINSGQIGTFLALGHYQVLAAALAIVLVVGLVLAWAPGWGRELRGRAAVPAALLIGGIVFGAITVQGRWISGAQTARSNRYLYLGAVFVLPALAVAADEFARRWRMLTPVVVALFVIAIPANIGEFGGFPFGENYFNDQERILTTAVRVPLARQVPRDVRPIPDTFVSRHLTIGFLLDADTSGKLHPSSGSIPPPVLNEFRIRLGVAQSSTSSNPFGCPEVIGPLDLTPARGSVFTILSPVTISTHQGAKTTSRPVDFFPTNGKRLTVEVGGLNLRFAGRGARPFRMCT